MLSEMKKSSASMNRKFRSIPGNLKVDISAPGDNMPCCLTSNLWEIDPFPDNRSRRPTREIEEFPPMDVYAPHTTYKYVCVSIHVYILILCVSMQEHDVCVPSKSGLQEWQGTQCRGQGSVHGWRGQGRRVSPHLWEVVFSILPEGSVVSSALSQQVGI